VLTLLIFGRAGDAGPNIFAYADKVAMEADVNSALKNLNRSKETTAKQLNGLMKYDLNINLHCN